MLNEMPRLVRLRERHLALVFAEFLHFFERILLDARSNALLCDAVEIDNYFAAQEPIHFFLPSGVPKHQAFHRTGFVGCIMINMQIGKAFYTFEREIDEPFERYPLLCPVEGPTALIDKVPLIVRRHQTKEVFKSPLS